MKFTKCSEKFSGNIKQKPTFIPPFLVVSAQHHEQKVPRRPAGGVGQNFEFNQEAHVGSCHGNLDFRG